MQIDLSTFQRNTQFYGKVSLLITIKSYNLSEIRARYIASKQNKSNRTGSVERREPSLGGVVALNIQNGKIEKEIEVSRMKEPRGIDFSNGKIAIASENTIYVFQDNEITKLENDWFSYIHTVKFSNQNTILVSSSGYDCLMEFSLEDFSKTWEWFAWENGFDTGKDPLSGAEFKLTRNPDLAKDFHSKGIPYLHISDPKTQNLPTARRSAFINSAYYSLDEKSILATFFHKGAVYQIDKVSGTALEVLSGMKNPHGGCEFSQGIMATSTGTGEIIFKTKEGENKYFTGNLQGKHQGFEDFEWVQNSIIQNNIVITIDSNRTSFIIIDIQNKMYDLIPYNSDWAVQDLINIDNSQSIEKLKEALGKIL